MWQYKTPDPHTGADAPHARRNRQPRSGTAVAKGAKRSSLLLLIFGPDLIFQDLTLDLRIEWLGASRAGLRRRPGIDRVVTDPERDVAPVAQRFVIFCPVFDAIRGCVFRMAVGSFMMLRHALHHWLLGLVMSKHIGRYNEHQVPIGDSCTKPWLSRISTLEALYEHDDSDLPDSTSVTTPPAALRSARRKRRRRRS